MKLIALIETVLLTVYCFFGSLFNLPDKRVQDLIEENSGYIYGQDVDEHFGEVYVMTEPFMLIQTAENIWLYIYPDGSFTIVLPDGSTLTGTIRFDGDIPVFALDNGTELVPTVDADGNYNYDLNVQGFALRFTLNAEAVGQLRARLA